MKLPDSLSMESSSYFTVKEAWRREWEFGVQVCVSPDQIPKPAARTIDDSPDVPQDFRMPPTHFTEENTDSQCVQYDLDDMDINWLERVNLQRKFRALAGPEGLSEDTFREAIIALESKCQQNMACAVATEENLGIEYDEGTVCDVCRDRESEDTNDMIFCDSCNLCVHQACYGVSTIPKGRWLCRTCTAGEKNVPCILCNNSGGALKRVRPGNTNWAHLSCALWIPEVKIGNAEKMEPITNTEDIPPSRRNLVCCVCRRKQGACVQCSHPHCTTAYHITCAFASGLETHTRLDHRTNGVIHESYCPKHSPLHRSPTKFTAPSPFKNNMTHYSQLQQVREQFYTYVTPEHLSHTHSLPPKICVLLYNYWKLKRKSLHNRPLLSHLPIETAGAGLKAELALSRQYGLQENPDFIKIILLRQNLEKARNLVYMVQRRERLKKRLLNSQQELLVLESTLLVTEEGKDDTCEGEGGEEVEGGKGREEEEEEEMDTEHSVRQTRSMTHKMTESGGTSPVGSSPTSSLPPNTHNPLHTHHTPKPTLPLPQTYNHNPAATPATASNSLPQLALSLQPISSTACYPLPLPLNRPTNCKDAGSHVTSQEDHMMSHMTLRRRDLQCSSVQPVLAATLNDRLIRPKIRNQVVTNGSHSSPPSGIRCLAQLPATSKQDEPVLKTGISPPATSGPARNLRFRPYPHGKT